MRPGRCAERTEREFRCSICHAVVTAALFLLCHPCCFMHEPKILKDREKFALHFVLDEDVKRHNLLFENRCCYLKSNPLRTDPPHYKRYWHYSSLPLFLPSFPSSRFKPQGSQSSLLRRPWRPTSSSLTPCLNEKITTRRKKRTILT